MGVFFGGRGSGRDSIAGVYSTAIPGEGITMSDRIRVSVDQGVADVRLVRAEKMNALDQAMFDALIDTAVSLQTLPGLRAVVISGEGKAFCAGLDMANFGDMAGGSGGDPNLARKLEPRTHGISNRAQYAVMAWRDIPVPVFAAVHGVAFGGGLQVALAADVRYLAPGTRMSVMEIKWGLVPDMAGMLLMRDLARSDVVRELTYTGRIFEAQEAVSLGFATRVVENPLEVALAAAAEVAARSPHAIRAAKRLMTVMENATPEQILIAESREQDLLIRSPNQVEAVLANLQKRAPRFGEV
jgi:enoyl-CoA hydratase/carnithine racemase